MEVPIILCIDDQQTVLELRKATLESHGHCVQVASSSYAAMKILEGVPMTAVVLEFVGVQTGRDRRRSGGLAHQAAVSQPADHSAFSLL